ncbi:MAG: hypothetical protein WKF74_15085, partial [Pyrinomonadaceae bacterium]
MLNGQRPSLVALAALVAVLATTLPRPTSAQQSAIDTYAITNARIVTLAGAPIERGTLVIRNGLVEAVGANTTAPPDARVIDGAGLTIYPGIIDANTTLGIPAPSPQQPRTPGAGFGAPQQQGQQQTTAYSSPNSTRL